MSEKQNVTPFELDHKVFERIFEATQDVLFLVKVLPKGNFVYIGCNEAHVRVTGFSKEQFVGKTPQEVFGDELGKYLSQNYERCVKSREITRYEEELPLPSGTKLWRTVLTPIFKGKKIDYIVGAAHDITEIGVVKKAMDRNHRRLTSVAKILNGNYYSVQAFLDGILSECIVLTDSTCGLIFSVNAVGEEANVHSISSELLHHTFSYEKMWEQMMLCPQNKLDNLVSEGKMRSITLPVYLNGKVDAVMMVFGKTEDYEQEDAIQLSLAMNTLWNAVIRMKTENVLEEVEHEYELLYRNMLEGIALHELIYDESGQPIEYRILDVNPAFERILNVSKEIMVGKCSCEAYGMAEPPFLTQYEEVVRTGKSVSFENYVPEMDRFFKISAFTPQKGRFVTVFEDITDRKMWEKQIYSEKERLRITLQSIGDGVIATDARGKITMLNPIAEQLTGWSNEEAYGMQFERVFDIYNERTGVKCKNPVDKVLRTQKVIDLANHTVLISKHGHHISIADSAAPIINQQGETEGVVLVFRDVTAEKKKQDEIRYLSFHDDLTGLYNRTYFNKHLHKLTQADKMPLAIIIGDVNGLKLINDVFGHLEGDKLLKNVSKFLRKSCRKEDVIVRWGGDEFLILMPNTTEKVANQICTRIRNSLNASGDQLTTPSVSLGCAALTDEGDAVTVILKNAEDRMYRRKLLESKSVRTAIIASLERTLYEKSYETREHTQRIETLCIAIGKKMGLNQGELDELSLLALLHDIGKVAINDNILNKPSPLDEEEWEEMKRHSEIGYRVAQSSESLAKISEYILYHHERWDGNGYPNGLKEEEIPIYSRIVAVADAYDAMINDRPYRKALSIDCALREIFENAGKQFDPLVVKYFKEIV